MANLKIIYEDDHIIVVDKPYGVASQTERGTGEDMVSILMNYFHESSVANSGKQKAAPYVGVVHRLDKNVGGVMVYGKTKASTAKLSAQMAEHTTEKAYYAIAYSPENIGEEGVMTDYLIRDGRTNTSRVAGKTEWNLKDAKKAELSYKLIKLSEDKDKGLFDIDLKTGRHHQIRVQFSSRGCPLLGDRKYGQEANKDYAGRNIELYCHHIGIKHPVTGKRMSFDGIKAEEMYNKLT